VFRQKIFSVLVELPFGHALQWRAKIVERRKQSATIIVHVHVAGEQAMLHLVKLKVQTHRYTMKKRFSSPYFELIPVDSTAPAITRHPDGPRQLQTRRRSKIAFNFIFLRVQ
jgi:hypothetical protein